MIQIIFRLIFFSLIGLATACSSGGDGGGSPPASAVTITAANAKSVAQNAVVNGDLLLATSAIIGVEIYPSTQIPDPVELIQPIIDSGILTTLVESPAGISITVSCTDPDIGGTSGSISGDVNDTGSGASGSISFNACTVDGITISGSINFSNSFDTPFIGDYTFSMSGSLTISGSGVNIAFTGMSQSVEGNDNTGTYVINATYSLSGIPGGGFLVQTTIPLIGNDFSVPDCPTSGQVLVTGSGGTQVQITATGFVTSVEVNTGNGTFTPVMGSPFPCTEIFL